MGELKLTGFVETKKQLKPTILVKRLQMKCNNQGFVWQQLYLPSLHLHFRKRKKKHTLYKNNVTKMFILLKTQNQLLH